MIKFYVRIQSKHKTLCTISAALLQNCVSVSVSFLMIIIIFAGCFCGDRFTKKMCFIILDALLDYYD